MAKRKKTLGQVCEQAYRAAGGTANAWAFKHAAAAVVEEYRRRLEAKHLEAKKRSPADLANWVERMIKGIEGRRTRSK